MPYWQLFYHVIWATQYRDALLTPEAEPVMHGLLRSKALELGARVFALDGMEDHVHLVVSIPPKISVAGFIGKVKASASARFNKAGVLDRPFYWQDEYAALSLDAKRLPGCISYVLNQKRHHAEGGLVPALERIGGPDESTDPKDGEV